MESERDGLLTLTKSVAALQEEVDHINQRNVEKDRGKEFETSYTRVIFLMTITYCTLFGYMSFIKTNHPSLDAIVPTVGFNISTWSLPYIKEWWVSLKEYREERILRKLSYRTSADENGSEMNNRSCNDDPCVTYDDVGTAVVASTV